MDVDGASPAVCGVRTPRGGARRDDAADGGGFNEPSSRGRDFKAEGRTEGGGIKLAEDGVCALRTPAAGADCRVIDPVLGNGALGSIGAGTAFRYLPASWMRVTCFVCELCSSFLSSRLSWGITSLVDSC